MKKLIFVFFVFVTVAALTECSSRTKKELENQTEEDDDNKLDSLKGKEDYVADHDRYRKEVDDKLAENRRALADLKSKLKGQQQATAHDYKMKVNDLEQKNNDMKTRMDQYTFEGKEKWEKFKTDFNRDMDELARALKDLTNNQAGQPQKR